MSIGIVGDIHGCLGPLEEVAHGFESHTELVFLGDYVNRGRDSAAVIEFLLQTQQRYFGRAHFLSGNHDREFLRVLHGAPIDTLLRMGGAPTVGSYVKEPFGDVAKQLRTAMPQAHLTFLESLDLTFRAGGLVASHEIDIAPQGSFAVSGHSVQTTASPQVFAGGAYIDTGCGTIRGGRLTLFSWPEMTWIQSRPWDDLSASGLNRA